jgi:hypothetical protein
VAYSDVRFVPSFVSTSKLDRELGLGGGGEYTELFILNFEVFTAPKTHIGA